MDAIYRLVGFDRDTERVAVKYEILAKYVLLAKKIAGIDDRPIISDWPLSPEQVRHIAAVIGESIDPDAYDFSLEPYAPTTFQDRPAA
jgi:hypothetical protein